MIEVNWQLFRCRCSSIHAMMANSRSNPCLTDKQSLELDDLQKKPELSIKQEEKLAGLLIKKDNKDKNVLSDTFITYLVEEYAWKTEGMCRVAKNLMDIPQMKKGTLVEPESLALLSIVDGIEYKPNMDENGKREKVCNDFLIGEVDAYVGESIMTATCIPDVKSIWDYPTFLNKIFEPILISNDWQVKGYMDITGAREGFIANCLVDTPEEVINGLKWKLLNMMNVATEEDTLFKEQWAILERSMKFRGIARHKRVFKNKVDLLTEDQRNKLYDRVKIARDWLFSFHEKMCNLNK